MGRKKVPRRLCPVCREVEIPSWRKHCSPACYHVWQRAEARALKEIREEEGLARRVQAARGGALHIELSAAEYEVVVAALQDMDTPKTEAEEDARRRLTAIRTLAEGQDAQEVAESAGVAVISLRRWVKRFREKGIGGMTTLPRTGRPERLRPDQVALVKAEMRRLGPAEPDLTFRTFIAQNFGKRFGKTYLRKLLGEWHREVFDARRPLPVRQRKRIREMQREWRAKHPSESTG